MAATISPVPVFENLGSLITYKDEDGGDRCLGYLMHFEGRGVYDAYFGKVEIGPDDADTHNKCLSEGEIKGLDNNCEVGMRGTFYVTRKPGDIDTIVGIKTWTGTIVSNTVTRKVNGRGITYTFYRNGREYTGRVARDGDVINFKRTK